MHKNVHEIFGGYYTEVTPVPIPNTEVKLCSAYDTWREAARESWSLPEQKEKGHPDGCPFSMKSILRIGEIAFFEGGEIALQ